MKIEFSLVPSLKSRQFQEYGNKTNAHVCDRLRFAASFCCMAYCFAISQDADGHLGRELFVLIVFGQSRASN